MHDVLPESSARGEHDDGGDGVAGDEDAGAGRRRGQRKCKLGRASTVGRSPAGGKAQIVMSAANQKGPASAASRRLQERPRELGRHEGRDERRAGR